MKLQGLAVIAIIIILPMTLILTAYSQNQIKTLELQVEYDSKLKNATYDAVKSFQLNMSNSSTSDLADSKMRDISASVNTFYDSLSSNFNMSGYGRDVLQNYVPAIVYTLYDGYYIYSVYDNKLAREDKISENAKYQDGEKIDGLKPYIYYSCRYKPNSNSDFVITYSLDSYITIQGVLDGQPVNESGYLLTNVKKTTNDQQNDQYFYKEVEIVEENNNNKGLNQRVYVEGESEKGEKISIGDQQVGAIQEDVCKKVNGVKYYENSDGEKFAIINDKKYTQKDVYMSTNKNAIQYYKNAYEFKDYILNNSTLKALTPADAVDSYGQKYKFGEGTFNSNEKIFEELTSDNINIEDSNSSFNAHKLQVIKNSIESNLITAISNYNNVSTSDVNFAMPKLQEYEWEEVTQNISMISFLQGLNIGGKVYNGYAIVPNNHNEDYISEDSIYILNNDEYHKVTEEGLENNLSEKAIGILNTDFDRRYTVVSKKEEESKLISKPIYYYPKGGSASYKSIINANGNSGKSINETLKDAGKYKTTNPNKYNLAQIYYTALGRERFGMYRVTNKLEDIQEYLIKGFKS